MWPLGKSIPWTDETVIQLCYYPSPLLHPPLLFLFLYLSIAPSASSSSFSSCRLLHPPAHTSFPSPCSSPRHISSPLTFLLLPFVSSFSISHPSSLLLELPFLPSTQLIKLLAFYPLSSPYHTLPYPTSTHPCSALSPIIQIHILHHITL